MSEKHSSRSTNEVSASAVKSLQNVWIYTQNIWIMFVLITSFEKETTVQQKNEASERDEILTVN